MKTRDLNMARGAFPMERDMSNLLKNFFLVICIVMGHAGSAGAQEQLYDRFGRPIINGRVYATPPGGFPQQQVQPQPGYSPAPVRRSRYEQANVCATDYGTCQLPGPMFVGKGCNCRFAGVGKVDGFAVNTQ
jgi:hypothetical protein